MSSRPYSEVYARAKEMLEGDDPTRILEELDRVLSAADRELGERLEETVRLAEMALVARLDPWWTGAPQPNLRSAIGRAGVSLHDELALSLALRLGAGYARLSRVDDEAHRLALLARRVRGTELPHPESDYAEEAADYLERALFLPSAAYAYLLVKDLPAGEVVALAAAQLQRGNPSFAALLAELRLVRALDAWYVGVHLPNVETALTRWRESRPPELQELALLLARAYVKGAFVDLRAREHVLATLQGEEAQLLGADEAIGFQEYVDRNCFDYPYEHLYEQTKTLDPDRLRAAVRGHVRHGSLTAAQRLCEMSLVRRFDDWYFGDPASNVRNALERYLETAPGEDPDADWSARSLAGLYAATLEGGTHARRLVHAIVARDPAAPAFLEAIHSAGIPPDVTVAELHKLYRDVVEIGARVEAFRARAEEAGGASALSAYEQNAYAQVLEFVEAGESQLVGELSRTLGDLVEVVAPASLLRSVTSVVEDVLRLAASSARALLRRDRVLSELTKRDPALRSIDRIRNADLQLLDEVAWSITVENRVAAALEGLGCGLGGLTLVLVDVPMLVLVNLNAVAAIATVYGFDVEEESERELLTQIVAQGPSVLRRVLALHGSEEEAGILSEVGRQEPTSHAAMALHSAASGIATRLARQKLLQVVPILGGAVGAGMNFHFTYSTTRTAVMAYRLRWLLRRFGG
jgi:uncharacterized protein (DUF697 family)